MLSPLLDIPPPTHTLMVVVDSLDSELGYGTGDGGAGAVGAPPGKSSTIAELLASHQHLLPSWLLIVVSVRRHDKAVCKMFSGTGHGSAR